MGPGQTSRAWYFRSLDFIFSELGLACVLNEPTMDNKIRRLENALRQIDTAKKQLCRNTAEVSYLQGSHRLEKVLDYIGP